jgi:CubicO group peptidase (beta-lactamase class C family)
MGGSELSWRIGKTGYTGCAMVFDYYAQLGIIILTNRLMPERDEQRLRRFQQWRLETIDALLPK